MGYELEVPGHVEGEERVLTPEALEFVAELQRRELFERLVLADDPAEFLTLDAYEMLS